MNGYAVGWTLGYLINELNRDEFLPYEAPPRMLPLQYFVPFVIISGFFAIVVIVLLVVFFVKSRRNSA